MQWDNERVSLMTENNKRWLSKRNGASEIAVSRYFREDAKEVPFDAITFFAKTIGLNGTDSPYSAIEEAILTNKGRLTTGEKSKLIALLLSMPTKES